MKSSTPSKINCGSDALNWSITIPHFPGRRNTVPAMNVNGTKSFIAGPSEGTWKSSPDRASSKSMSSLPRQFLDNRTRNLLGSRTRLPSTKWLTNYLNFIPYRVNFLPILTLCTAFLNKYYSMLLIFYSTFIRPHAPLIRFLPLGGSHYNTCW